MSQTSCAGSVELCCLRIAKLNDSGIPLPGSGNLYVTDQAIELTFGAEISAGDDIERKNGCGDIKLALKERDRLKRITLTLQLTYPDPEITQLLIGGDLITSGGTTIGYLFPQVGLQSQSLAASIEAWSKRADGGGQSSDFPYFRWIFPKTKWQISDRSLNADPMVTEFKGFAEENANWYNGPSNDWPHASNRLLGYRMETTIPTAACGAQSLTAS